jgi:hypothetical protein
MASLKLFINESASSAQNGLVTGFFSLQSAPPVTFQQGDNGRAVELHFLSENPDQTDPTRPFVYNTPPAAATLAVGTIGGSVNSGTFTITETDVGQTTAAIAYNASAATLQAALRAGCPARLSACVVTGNAGGPWTVDGVNTNSSFTPTASTAAISPVGSTMVIVETQADTAALSNIYYLSLNPAPAILTTSWTASTSTAAAVTTTTVGSVGVNEVQRLTLQNDIYDGFFSLSLALPHGPIAIQSNTAASPTVVTAAAHGLATGDSIVIATNNGSNATIVGTNTVTVITANTFSIPVNCTSSGGTTTSFTVAALTRTIGPCAWNISEADLEAALELHSSSLAVSGSFAVARSVGTSIFYDITFRGDLGATNIAQMTVTDSLIYPTYLNGTINARTSGVLALIGSSTSAIVTNLEVQKTVSAIDTTVALRLDTSIQPELISSTPGTPSAGVSYYTTMTAVGSGPALGITTLAGSGATALAGQVTLGQTRGRQLFINDVTYGFGLWENATGTTAENIATGTLRAGDYATTTNESLWLRRL